ncbi:MAG: hypothetical protein ACQEP5_00840 [Actinomycetota bacterium]
MIALQVSLYPVGQKDIEEALNAFWATLDKEGINYKVTPLSTIAWGNEEKKLYNAVFSAYRQARKFGRAVMVTTLTTGDEQDIGKLLDFLPE